MKERTEKAIEAVRDLIRETMESSRNPGRSGIHQTKDQSYLCAIAVTLLEILRLLGEKE